MTMILRLEQALRGHTSRLPISTTAAALAALGALAFATGCAHKPSQGGEAGGRQTNGELAFHKSIQLDDYVQGFAHDDILVPERAEAVLNVAPFATNQPEGNSRTLAQIAVRMRAALPEEASKESAASAFASAVLTVKAAPGFSLIRLHGADRIEPTAGGLKVSWDSLHFGEWKIIIAELEGSLPPSVRDERLVGATLRCARLKDGYLFETISGSTMDWHRVGAPAKVNKWVARNSLVYSNGEALMEVGRLAERGDYAPALSLVDLQMNSIQALRDFDAVGLDAELQRFSKVRAVLAERLGPKAQPAEDVAAPSEPTPEALRTRAAKGVELSTQAPPGVWGTLANLIVLRTE